MQALHSRGWSAAPRGGEVLAALAVLALVTALATALREWQPDPAWLFLAAVLVNAAGWGFWIGLSSALLAFLSLNFLFVDPLYTLQVTDLADVIRLVQFLGTAALTGFLAGRLREEAAAAKARARVVTALSAQVQAGQEGVLAALVRALADLAGGPAAVIGAEGQVLAAEGAAPGPEDLAAAERALRRGRVEDAIAPGWEGARLVFRPLGVGLVAGHAPVDRRRRDAGLIEEAVGLALAQGAQALAGLELSRAAAAAQRRAEAEGLRAALLSSVSHDLRTPLATILGAASSLRELGGQMTPEARDDLVAAIEEEAGRLSRQVENLLQMTRLQAGIALRKAPVDLGEVVEGVRARAARAFPEARVEVRMGPVPMIEGEAQLLEQALFNLIDNAVKFAGTGAPIVLAVEAGAALEISVTDAGPGIAEAQQEGLFQPFFRGDARPAGFGLGLSIAQGVALAHGGSIRAESPVAEGPDFEHPGTRITLSLPLGAT